jgi:putative transposase
MMIVSELSKQVGVAAACQAVAIARSSFYRSRRSSSPKDPLAVVPSTAPPLPARFPRSLSDEEKSVVRETLNSPRFVDQTPREVYATLLDEGRYLCSWRTMYRVLEQNQEVKERRAQTRHPKRAKPELVATAPNQLWSWDITKLLGPTKGTFYYLYVIIDVFSRYNTGWLLANRESDVLAKQLVHETCIKQEILPNQLTLHADRGSSMKSKLLAMLLDDLGVIKTHSRPRVSNDNPYSESQFKTMKYHPDYPDFFGSLEDARSWVRKFFSWYNNEHYHNALGLLTPASVHYGQAAALLENRQGVLNYAYAAHPERFVKKPPTVLSLPDAVWINRPQPLLDVGATELQIAENRPTLKEWEEGFSPCGT